MCEINVPVFYIEVLLYNNKTNIIRFVKFVYKNWFNVTYRLITYILYCNIRFANLLNLLMIFLTVHICICTIALNNNGTLYIPNFCIKLHLS